MTGGEKSPLTPEQQLDVLLDLFPWARQFRAQPLRHYAAALYDARDPPDCDARLNARAILCNWVERTSLRRGFSRSVARKFAGEIASFPVLQTGPHLHLLIEPDAFFTHVFSLLGLAARNSSAYVSYACSTVKFTERGRKGPGWLTVDGQSVNVFGLSAGKMTPSSIVAENRECKFAMSPVASGKSVNATLAELSQILPNQSFPSAAKAIKAANQVLWKRYMSADVDFLQLDDDDIADLALAHLADPSSWLRLKFLADPTVPLTMLRAIDRLSSTPWRNWLKNTTHFFWFNKEGRLSPLFFDGRYLRPAKFEDGNIPFTEEGLATALASRRIIPNLFLAFMMIAILPGVRALGGSRQTVYYPLMRHAFCSALIDSGKDDELLRSLLHDRRSGGWGHRVLDDVVEPIKILETLQPSGTPTLLSAYGGIILEQACGSLDAFRHDGLWIDLAADLSKRVINTMSSPWAFA